MGDISIISRRLTDGKVQYGWSGNGGYYSHVGFRLLDWYNSPELVEYLFGLGELKLIGKPGSERIGAGLFYTHQMTGISHHFGMTEREIFSKLAFVDYGYFYDLDHVWYYVVPGPLRIKIPLAMVDNNLGEGDSEFGFVRAVQVQLIEYIFHKYGEKDADFEKLFEEQEYDKKKVEEEILNDECPVYKLFEYKWLFQYFDDWVVVVPDEKGKNVATFKMMKKTEIHIETIEW